MRSRGRWAAWPLLAGALVAGGCGARPAGLDPGPFTGRRLVVLVGSASQPPTAEAVSAFAARTGARIEAHYGGSGELLARLQLAREGDVYFPGSSDYLELARTEGLLAEERETQVAYLVPAINVPRGNPKEVRGLRDLARPGLRIAIARPDTVCVGLYAVEVLERSGLAAQVRKNIVTHAESCAKVAQLVALGQVDAALGWEVFAQWDPARIETVHLAPAEVPRIGVLPAARTAACRDPELAQAFLDFLVSEEGRAIYRRWNYLASVEDARPLASAGAPVGGLWPLPLGW
jgi:molybdate transport system substrate-binding protein